MTQITVIYEPATQKASNESFEINTDTVDSVICELKRKIFANQGILPIDI